MSQIAYFEKLKKNAMVPTHSKNQLRKPRTCYLEEVKVALHNILMVPLILEIMY